MTVRDYTPSDFDRVREIHETSEIDYQFPDLSSPLFLVTKVVEVDGIVRACGGLYLQVECYLWMDHSNWDSPEHKLDAIRELDRACMDAAWMRGVNDAVLWLPPGMERFGERLIDMGFSKDRPGWVSYSKKTK